MASFIAMSLKLFNEDLNILEVYAYVHDEYQKHLGNYLQNTSNHLPNIEKRQYLGYLDKNRISLIQDLLSMNYK